MEKQGSRQFVIVDQSLKTTLGHFYEYTGTAEEALRQAGYEVTVLASRHLSEELKKKSGWRAVFSFDWHFRTRLEAIVTLIWLALPASLARTLLKLLPLNSFGRELQFQLQSLDLGKQDQVLIHTLNFVQMIETAMAIYSLDETPLFHVVLRMDPEDNARGGLKNFLLRTMIRKADATGRIHFYSDTGPLCEAYAALSGVSFFRLPILFDESWVSRLKSGVGKGPLTVCYLGDGRSEKGYQFLPEIARQTLQKSSGVRFLFQSVLSPHASQLAPQQRALRELASQYPNQIVLFEKALDSEAYYGILAQSHVVLLPYQSSAYRLRSSGIQAQGVAFGATVIVPEGTAMAEDSPSDQRLIFREFDEIPDLILQAAQRDFAQGSGPSKIKEEFVSALQIR